MMPHAVSNEPFGEVTNRTPSPSAKDDPAAAGRKHSPWTAARHKKKTRCARQQHHAQQEHSDAAACAALQPQPQPQPQPPTCFNSPEASLKTAGCGDAGAGGCGADFSLAGALSSSASSPSPHSSPPICRGSEADAEVHPCKAYIVGPRAERSPDAPGSVCMDGGCTFAPAALGEPARSPLWFGSAALQEDAAASAAAASGLQHSSSAPAPASNILFERFDRAASQPEWQQQQQQQQLEPAPAQAQPEGGAPAPAPAPGGVAGRRRGLVARRRSWGGTEALSLRPSSTAVGVSRLGGSGSSGSARQQRPLHAAAAGAGSAAAAAGGGFELRSRLHGLELEGLDRVGPSCGLLQRLHSWGSEDDSAAEAAARGCCCDQDMLAAGGSDTDPLVWYEQQLQEAAEEGDLAAAQQLWASMQASATTPTRRALHCYLMCCHYGGGDPLEAQEAVREMCSAAGFEPDATTARLLAAIDISWQQLHCEA